jgi:D-serine deaminase-like pyridoxal phosphate-dependent protein
MRIQDLPTPALLLDLDILDHNLREMQHRADRLGVALRPHFKTHKSIPVLRRQEALGSRGVTVSTFYEAEQCAAAGCTDITWAFPFPPVYADRAAALAQQVVLRLVIDSLSAVESLEQAARRSGIPLHLLLKVDSGLHRAGVLPEDPAARILAHRIADSPHLLFDGILTHAGHSYTARSVEEIRSIGRDERRVMAHLADELRADGLDVSVVSVGSTPTMSFAEDLRGVTEMRPGNYVFHDLTMVSLEVCGVADCAVTVLGSVVSTHGTTVLTDAGALALSKDTGATQRAPDAGFGLVFAEYGRQKLIPAAEVHVVSLSQEHGLLVASPPGRFSVGERVRILEQHSCLTVALFDHVAVVRGEDVLERWPICRGRTG